MTNVEIVEIKSRGKQFATLEVGTYFYYNHKLFIKIQNHKAIALEGLNCGKIGEIDGNDEVIPIPDVRISTFY